MEKSELIVKFEEKFKKIFPNSGEPINKEIKELQLPDFNDRMFEEWRKKK